MQAEQVDNRGSGWTTVKGASAFTAISVARLYELMNSGVLPYAKVGKSRRIAWSALHELMRRHTVTAAGSESSRN